MPNTVNQTAIIRSSRRVINYITVTSDGSEETDLVVYDSSAIAALVGITDPQTCQIENVWFSGSKVANTGTLLLEFDATTDVVALPINFSATGDSHMHMCFEQFAGLKNYAGTGKTGDILLTTTGLDSGDSFMLVLDIRL